MVFFYYSMVFFWCRSMTITLSSKNKLVLIDGTIEKPNAKKTTELALWQRCNDMVLTWIVNILASDITSSVMYLRTAGDVWEDFKREVCAAKHLIQRESSRTT